MILNKVFSNITQYKITYEENYEKQGIKNSIICAFGFMRHYDGLLKSGRIKGRSGAVGAY